MSAKISRRTMLASAAKAAGCMFIPAVAVAQDRRGNYYRRIEYSYSSAFNDTEARVIRGAVNVVAKRMLDPRMFSNAKRVYRRWYANIPGRRIGSTAEFEAWFTRVQLPILLEGGFPRLRINAQYVPRADWVGRAPVGTVKTVFGAAPPQFGLTGGASQWRPPVTEGSFEITLNKAYLGERDYSLGRDEAYWAGVIAHEMLHNLGHTHPEGVYDGVFIRDYQNAIRHNGTYRPGLSLVGSDEVVGCGTR